MNNTNPTAQPPIVHPDPLAAYDLVDRFLRNNLGDDDYAEYSAALEAIRTACPQRCLMQGDA